MNELQTSTITGSTVYAVIRSSAALVWNVSTSMFENFTNADWSNYIVPLTEQGTSGYFVGNFPTLITTADSFGIEFYSGAGTESDVFIAGGILNWNGTASTFAPTGTNLAALTYVKNYGNITVSTYDGYLTNRIVAASAEIVNYTNNNFTLANYTDIYDGPGSLTLKLANWPVTAVTSVTLEYGSNNPTVVPGANITIDSANGMISYLPSATFVPYFPYGIQNIQVIYSAGYANIPVDVQEAVAKIVMNKFAIMLAGNVVTGGGGDMTMSSEQMTDYKYTRREDANRSISNDIMATLFHYKDAFI
jgi:hypothetical protein